MSYCATLKSRIRSEGLDHREKAGIPEMQQGGSRVVQADRAQTDHVARGCPA